MSHKWDQNNNLIKQMKLAQVYLICTDIYKFKHGNISYETPSM